MTLTEVQIYKKDKNDVENLFFLESKENIPPPEFLKKVRGIQRQRTKEFLDTPLNQDLEPNFQPKAPCACPSFSKLTKSQEASKPGNSQEGHNAPPDNIFTSVRMTQTHKQPTRWQKQKRVEMKSDWSNSDDGKDNQVRKRPIRHNITSDWETETEDQETIVRSPIKKAQHYAKGINVQKRKTSFSKLD